MKSIQFVSVVQVEGVFFSPHRPKGLEFYPDLNCDLKFELKPNNPEEDGSGHRLGLELKVYATYTVDAGQSDFVHAYINKRVMLRVADGIKLPYEINGKCLIGEDGAIAGGFSPHYKHCPADILDVIKKVEGELASSANRFLRLLRWRQQIDSQAEIVKSRGLYWRVAEGSYHITPLPDHYAEPVTIPAMFGIHWGDRHENALRDLWLTDCMAEPLGHTLMREASSLSVNSPRSAILILGSALESAVKIHISRFAPETAWLMEKIPSPPIDKILKEYIPDLHSKRGRNMDFWCLIKPRISRIGKFVEIRNKVAHTGRIPDGAEPIWSYIDLVSDMLYVLDFLDGHEWAKAQVGQDLRQTLQWPNPEDPRCFVTIHPSY